MFFTKRLHNFARITNQYSMRKIFLLLMLLPCFSHLYAQKYNVTGKVSNTLGEDLSYVNITILNATDSVFVNGTTANDTGAFSLAQSAGRYIIRFSYLGYKTKYQDIHVVSQNIDMKSIKMEDDAIVLNEVVAKASRPTIKRNATGFLVSVENAKHLQNKTLDRILNVSPGIYVDKDGVITINGRDGITVIVNDKTLHLSGEQLVSYLKSIQGSDLKNIEIMSNPTSSYDAEGVGGVIQINTKRKKDAGLSGYVSSNFSYTKDATYDEAAGVSYSIKDVTIYGNYSFNRLKTKAERYTTDIFDDGTKYNASADYYAGDRTNHTYKFGVDWDISNKHYIGVEYKYGLYLLER